MNRSIAAVAVATALVFTGASSTLALGLAEPDDRGCGRLGRPVSTQEVLECVAPSVAFIETAMGGSGSGVLVDGRHIVTNAHVVDPFDAVDVAFPGGERHEDVPVIGVDLVADIAVIGPVGTERPLLDIADFEGGKGDDLYLVGFPGEVDDEPEPTISRGILSRTRTSDDFDLTFLQTDASIGGGQSGGALVDDRGQVVGVSGFSFAEQFALALSGGNTRASIERILDGDVPGYAAFHRGPGETSGTFTIDTPESVQVLTVHTGEQPETIRLTLPADMGPIVLVVDLEGEPLFQNEAFVDSLTSEGGFEGFDLGEFELDATPDVAPGVYEFEVPADTYAGIFIGSGRPGPTTMRFASSVPLGRYDDVDQDRPVRLGERLEGILDSLETEGDSFVLDLREDEEVEIHASSATGDVGFAVEPPGAGAEEVEFVDDSGEGLFGFDAKDTYTARRAGEHRITVYSADGRATAYALRIDRR